MKTVIIPSDVVNDGYINLSDVSSNECIVAFDGNKVLGFVLEDEDHTWSMLRSSYLDYSFVSYNTLAELVKKLKESYKDFNLKVL